MRDRLQQFRNYLSRPVDGGSLALFRVFFGLAIAWSMFKWLLPENGRTYLQIHFLDVGWTFPYPGFEWVTPLSGRALFAWFLIAGFAGLLMAAGLWYRLSAALVFIGFGYFFFLDAALFNNHYYLICLLAFLMILMPADRRFSLGHLLRRNRSQEPDPSTVPMWTVFLLRSQLFVVYFFGGIAKLDWDWLTGEPMIASGMAAHDFLARLMTLPATLLPIHISQVIAWIGLAFDLSIGFLLLIPRTRLLAIALMAVFHGINHLLLPIGVFPFLAFTASLIFLEPDWPGRFGTWLRSPRVPRPDRAWLKWGAVLVPGIGALMGWRLPARKRPVRTGARSIGSPLFVFVIVWVAVQCLLPFRHFLIAGDPSWTEEGQYFAWRMMLRQKAAGHLTLHLQDPGIYERGPDGTTTIDWSRLPGAESRAIFLPIDARKFDWKAQKGLNTIFGGLTGYRVVYAVQAAADPDRLETEKRRLEQLWKERTGDEIEVRETVSLEECLKRIRRTLREEGESTDAGNLSRVKSSMDAALGLVAQVHDNAVEDRDPPLTAIHDYLGGALQTEFQDTIRSELGLLHPFALKGADYPGQHFLVLAHIETAGALQSVSERLGNEESYGVWADFGRLRFYEWKHLPLWFPVVEGEGIPILWNYFRELNLRQTEQLAVRPLLIRQYARRIADLWEEESGRRPVVHGYTNVMMNYRYPRPLVSAGVDLASVDYSFLHHNEWILPQMSERIGVSK